MRYSRMRYSRYVNARNNNRIFLNPPHVKDANCDENKHIACATSQVHSRDYPFQTNNTMSCIVMDFEMPE